MNRRLQRGPRCDLGNAYVVVLQTNSLYGHLLNGDLHKSPVIDLINGGFIEQVNLTWTVAHTGQRPSI
jgi:hypothetical protein